MSTEGGVDFLRRVWDRRTSRITSLGTFTTLIRDSPLGVGSSPGQPPVTGSAGRRVTLQDWTQDVLRSPLGIVPPLGVTLGEQLRGMTGKTGQGRSQRGKGTDVRDPI